MKSPEMDLASIVMLGSFNPTIFQPRWLGAQKLIRSEEAENAKISTIQAEVTDFKTEWFHLQVLQQRFQISCSDPRQYAPLRDLAAGMFLILPHTPVTALGMNRAFHFEMPSEEVWHELGHLLAPKSFWNATLQNPGMRSITIQGTRQEGGGVVQVKVEPSVLVKNGVYIYVNEEFKAPEKDSDGARWVPQRLMETWEDIMKFSESASEHLLGLVKQPR